MEWFKIMTIRIDLFESALSKELVIVSTKLKDVNVKLKQYNTNTMKYN